MVGNSVGLVRTWARAFSSSKRGGENRDWWFPRARWHWSRMGKCPDKEPSCGTQDLIKMGTSSGATGIVSTREKGKEFMSTNTAAVEADLAVRPFHVDIAEEASSTSSDG